MSDEIAAPVSGEVEEVTVIDDEIAVIEQDAHEAVVDSEIIGDEPVEVASDEIEEAIIASENISAIIEAEDGQTVGELVSEELVALN